MNGVVDVTDGDTAISDNGFRQILAENQIKDIVIKSNDELSFTFGKGTMSAVDNVSSYDFGVKIVKEYSELGTLPSAVNKNIFIEQIKYNYSGQLPAEAQIRIFVGTRYAGKTLYYSRLFDNGTIDVYKRQLLLQRGISYFRAPCAGRNESIVVIHVCRA